jgi:hypothetical protein
MEIAERIDYLVKELTCDNGRAFALKVGMPDSSVSKWRNGSRKPSRMAMEKILAAYPEVRREWLVDGKGQPFVGKRIPKDITRELMERVDALGKKMDRILDMMEKFR